MIRESPKRNPMVEHDEKLKEIYKNVDYVDSLSYTSVNFKYN